MNGTSMEQLPLAIGLLGGVCALVAYGLASTGRLSADHVWYSTLNLIAALSILISLIAQWNLPVFLLNAASVMIGILGLVRVLRLRRRKE